MEKKRKLGRGLDEVADLWLSSTSITSEQPQELNEKLPPDQDSPDTSTRFTLKTISILYPESAKVKGLLVTNLALEIAKLGYGSCILDYGLNRSPPLRSMMGSLSQEKNQGGTSESHQIVRLYGMPSVHLFCNAADNPSGAASAPQYTDNLYSQVMDNNLQESIIFLYHQDTLEVISQMKELPSTFILISRPCKESLLICYAYIKTILSKKFHTRIWLIMDEVVDRDQAVKAFNDLSQITLRRVPHLHKPLNFLGSMVHDQALGICLATHFPLVLSEENSAAKESITRIATNLVKLIDNPD